MKKKGNFTMSIVAILLVCILSFGLACNKTNNDSTSDSGSNSSRPDPTPSVTVTITTTGFSSSIRKGDTVQLSAEVTNAEDKTVAWSSSNSDVVTVSDKGLVKAVGDVKALTEVVVTATANADKTKTASVTFTVVPAIEGEYGDLKAALFEEISNPNITITGTATDYYIDNENTYNNDETKYTMTVKMEDGKWYGEWQQEADPVYNPYPTVFTSNYRRGDEVGAGTHAFAEIGVNRHNEVVTTVQKDYLSHPYTWEANHLWNHLGYLGADISNKYEYEPEYGTYYYKADFETIVGDAEASDDAYLLTYLSYSLTPMLSDTIQHLRLKVEDNHITTIYGQTVAQSNKDEDGNVLQTAYTEVVLHISDIGSTKVPDPTPYEHDSNDPAYDDFVELLSTMKGMKNYTFTATDTATYTASAGEGYDYTSADGSDSAIAPLAYHPHTQMTGKVGRVGYVTENIILFEDTGEYTSYDTNPYYVDYSGYKQYYDDDGTPSYYETFATKTYDAGVEKVNSLVATKRNNGSMFEKVMPLFDFSPDIFENIGSNSVKVGNAWKEVYTYVLRDTSLTNEIARQISASGYERYAAELAVQQLKIQIDEDGNLVQTIFPYNMADNWMGYITTTYSNIGHTELDEADFSGDNYIERAWKAKWTDHTAKDYPAYGNTINAADLLNTMFGAGAADAMPSPELFMDIFGDNISGPWYEEDNVYGDDRETVIKTVKHFDITIRTDNPEHFDENNRLVDVAGIFGADGEFTKAITALDGWELDKANTGFYMGDTTSDMFFASYINADAGLQIKVETNGTWNIFFEVYKLGEWQNKYM